MIINGRHVCYGENPYIVAELGAAHNGSLETAIKIIEIAAACGADAVKFQCFTPDTITMNVNSDNFVIKSGPWKGASLHSLYARAHTPRGWFPVLFQRADDLGITPFASVFSKEDVDFMEQFDCPIYKISSFELVDTPLISYVASKGRPIILSTGMSSSQEVDDGVRAAMSGHTAHQDVIKLHCVSAYPTELRDSRLHAMMRGDGLSDHSIGPDVAIAATALGASIIEKHLTLSRQAGGLDDGFASEPEEFEYMVKAVRGVHNSVFPNQIERPADIGHAALRRSLYFSMDVKDGYVITDQNVRSIRPSGGMHPAAMNEIMGLRVIGNHPAGTPLTIDMLEMKK